jgi:hypothetical protein
MQGAGAEGGDPQLAAGAQAAGEFGQGAARGAPLQRVAGPDGVQAGVGEGQVFEVGAQGQGQAGRVAAQHGRGEIEGDQVGGREALVRPARA